MNTVQRLNLNAMAQKVMWALGILMIIAGLALAIPAVFTLVNGKVQSTEIIAITPDPNGVKSGKGTIVYESKELTFDLPQKSNVGDTVEVIISADGSSAASFLLTKVSILYAAFGIVLVAVLVPGVVWELKRRARAANQSTPGQSLPR